MVFIISIYVPNIVQGVSVTGGMESIRHGSQSASFAADGAALVWGGARAGASAYSAARAGGSSFGASTLGLANSKLVTGMLMAVNGFSYALYQSTQVKLVPYIVEVERLDAVMGRLFRDCSQIGGCPSE